MQPLAWKGLSGGQACVTGRPPPPTFLLLLSFAPGTQIGGWLAGHLGQTFSAELEADPPILFPS